MNLNLTSFIISAIFFFSSLSVGIAQNIKYGKVSKAELQMASYDRDTDAKAVILYENQYIEFPYQQGEGFKYQLKRHIRIKVLDKSGIDYVDWPIYLYHTGRSTERLIAFKATTFNLVDGKIQKDKIGPKDTFKEELNKYYTLIKYAMPNVQKGSVVDISYTVTSDFLFSLSPWQFQYNIPVIKSNFFVEIPEYLIYKTTLQGFESSCITKRETKQGNKRITIKTGSTFNMADGKASTKSDIDYITQQLDWVAEHIPAFKNEPFMSNPSNYLSKIEFELTRTNFPSGPDNFTQTWNNVRQTLMNDSDYGGRLRRLKPVSGITAELITGTESDRDKVAKIFHYVQNNIKWNGSFSHFPKNNAKKVLNAREGFSSDINFLLLQMLRAAEIEAYPVSISTRGNGFVNPITPKITQFNHVLAAAKIGDGFVLLDATDPYATIEILPEYDLNERGRLFTESTSDWVSLQPTKKRKTVTQAKMNLTEEGVFEGSIKMLLTDYAAKDFRQHSKSASKNTAHFIHSGNEEGLEVLSSSVENADNLYKKIITSYDVKIHDKAVSNGDLLYFEPLLFFGVKENPFTSEKRKFPVDLLLPVDKTYILQLTIPEGYVVEELPENISFSLPDKGGRFAYEYRLVNENLLQLTNRMSIKTTFYFPKDYPALREFYNLIVEKQGAQVVLRKTD